MVQTIIKEYAINISIVHKILSISVKSVLIKLKGETIGGKTLNISEIAKIAGVSSATVSRYLNNGYVSEDKKEKIRMIIEQTGYVPSSQAQMLRTRKTKLIGVILPKISSETIGKVVDGISEKLASSGYHIILANTDNNIENELEYLNIFRNNQVDGLIFIATIINNKHKKLLKEMPIPVVIIGQELEGYCCVYHDDYNAAKSLVNEIIGVGCKKLAYIGAPSKDKAAGLSRKKAFLEAIEANSEKVEAVALEEGPFSMESGYELAKKVLKDHPEIDGIFCATDTIAVGAIEAIKEVGKAIPEEISIVGMGDTKLSKVVSPKLTTVKYYYRISGVEGASMLLDMIEQNQTYNKKIKLGYEIIGKESVKI